VRAATDFAHAREQTVYLTSEFVLVMQYLRFDMGTLLLKGDVGTPYGKWDPRVDCYRIKAVYYRDALT
jgi:hypothetical protein